jgi:hypothetical protein
MKHFILLLVVTTFLFSCGKKTDEKNSLNPVSYVMKDFKLESAGGCVSDTIPCASYEVNYPEFSGLDSVVTKKIAHKIDSVVTEGYSEGLPQTFRETAPVFIQQYEDYKTEAGESESPGQGWSFHAGIKVEVLSDTLISLSVIRDDYAGGAHPNSSTVYLNIDPQNGRDVTLVNIFKPGFQDVLAKLGEKAFRKAHELSDTASLQGNDFEFENNQFQLTKNYGFTKAGVVFYYNSYEVAPYAMGPTEILIPYEEMKDWLK